MKTLTCIISSLSLILAMAFSAHSQNVFKVAPVGIGTVNPAQALDVSGNVKFSGALMPAGISGVTGNILLSGGAAPASPTWLPNGTNGQALTSTGTGVIYAAAGYWNLTGNAGTNPTINFIGTTNDEPLIFATNATASTATGAAYSGQIDPQFIGATLKGNTYLGEGSSSNTDVGAGNSDAGTYNVGIGVAALGLNTTGAGNVALASFLALGANTTGSYNIGIGRNLRFNWQGNGNIAVGYQALQGQSNTVSYNTGVGYQAAYGYGGPGGNTGSATNGIGWYNTALGYDALLINASSNASSNTAVGNYTDYASTGKQNTGTGDSALFSNTTGSFNTALGYQANVNAGTYTNATVIGYSAKAVAGNSLTLGSTLVAYNAGTGAGLYIPGYTPAVGSFYYTSAASGLVASLIPGTNLQYLESNGAGSVPTWASVTPTAGTVTNLTGTAPIVVTGSWVVGIQGNSSGTDKGGVLYSTGAGNSALFTPTGTAGQLLTSNGASAPTWGYAFWNLTGNVGTNPAVNFVGTTDAEPLVFKTDVGGAYPTYAGQIDPGIAGFKGNTYMGEGVNGVGNQLGGGGDGGTYNVGIGCGTMAPITTGSYNVSLSNYLTLQNNTTGSYNVGVGYEALNKNTAGNGNIGIGRQTMFSQAGTVSYTTAIGYAAAYGSATTGNFNTALGSQALSTGLVASAFGASNTAMGSNAANNTTGKENTAIGDSALYGNTTGTLNTALGYQAHTSTGALTNATAIGQKAIAGASNTVILGNGAASVGINTSTPQRLLELGGTANTIRADGLGSGGTFNTQIATTGNVVYVNNANGDLYSLPNTGAVTGNVLTLNANGVPSWGPSVASSITKHNILPAAGSSVVPGGGNLNSVVGSSDVTLDIQGTAGGVFYGTGSGTPAAFSSAGTAGQVLLSNGAGAPTWVSPGSLLTTSSIVNAGANSAVNVTNGANQVVGASNVVLDVQGNSAGTDIGGVMYSTGAGTSALFMPTGTAGQNQLLTSNGALAPSYSTVTWNFTGGNNIAAPYGTDFFGTTNNQPLEFFGYNGGNNYNSTSVTGLIDPTNQNIYFGGIVNGASPGVIAKMPGGPTAGAINNVAIGNGSLGNAPVCCTTQTALAVGVSNNVAFGYGSGLSYNAVSNNNGSTAIGAATLRFITTGVPNTMIGYHSFSQGFGSVTTGGTNNLAMGELSENHHSTGTKDVAVGQSALLSATTSSDNVAVGYASLNNTSTSQGNNTAAGYEAAFDNTTGHNGTSLGYEANFTNSTTYGNTAIGANALFTNTSLDATAIGTNSLKSYTSGANVDVAIGDSAQFADAGETEVTIGALASKASKAAGGNDQSVAVGFGASQFNTNTTSFQGMSFGYLALGKGSPGSFGTVAIGANAIGNGTSQGLGNDAIGVAALYNLGSGAGNIAIGNANSVTNANLNAPLGSLTTGGSNIAIGFNAASLLLTGSNNEAIGSNSSNGGNSTTLGTGSENTAVGTSATAGSTTTAAVASSFNTALGYSASAGNIAALTDYSTAVGANAIAAPVSGTTAATTATALGASASATANNSTAIGANAVANTTNTLILGGTGANAVSVGIGTSSPAQELEIGGTVNTIRIDGVGSGGTFGNTAPSATTDQILFARALGDVYSIPNGSNGQVLTNVSGVPTWVSPAVYTATSPLTITSNNLLLSGTSGGVLYSTGSGSAFSAAGNPLNILTEDPITGLPKFDTIIPSSLSSHDLWGTQSVVTDSLNSVSSGDNEYTISGNGLPGSPLRLARQGASVGQTLAWTQLGANWATWKPSSANASLTTNNIASAGGAVTVANGTGQVVGGSNVTLDIRGTSGGLLEGNGSGSSATFSAAGTNGYIYTYTGAGASSWQPSAVTTPWGLTGNSGTVPGTNFIGTIDDKQFVFMSSQSYYYGNNGNPEAGSIDPQKVGATTYGNVYMGVANADNSNGPAGNNDQGTYNVSFGRGTMGNITSGSNNVALGNQTFTKNNGSNNVVAGDGMFFYGSANGITAIGIGNFNTQSANNVTYIGPFANSASNTGTNNTTLGYNTLTAGGAGQSNTALGTNALISTTVSHNTAAGDSALSTNTTGANNTALGYKANVASAALTNATAIGYLATAPVSNSVTLGNTSATSLYIPGYNTTGSLYYTSAASGLVSPLTPGTSTYLLQSNGPGNVPAWANITPGSGTVTNVTGTAPIIVNGSWNINIQGTGANAGSVLYSTGAGNPAAFNTAGTTGQFLLSGGAGMPTWGPLPGSTWSLNGNVGTTSANFLGTTDAHRLEFGVYNSSSAGAGYSGSIDMGVVTNSTGTNGFGNTYLGPGSTNTNGNFGPGNNDIGEYNVGIGRGTMADVQNNSVIGNVGLGTLALNGASGAYSYDVAIGYTAGISITTATGDIIIQGNPHGSTATTTGSYDVAIGVGSGTSGTSNYNNAVGWDALLTTTTGASNTGIGSRALQLNTTGSRNTAMGDSALYTNTTGANNTGIGYRSNVSTAALTNAIAIGYLATATASNSMILGNTTTPPSVYLPGYGTTGSLFYTSAANGLVGQTGAGPSDYLLQSNGPGVAPTWVNITIGGSGTVTSVTGVPPMYVSPTWNVGIQGNNPNTDKGGVLYSTGAGSAATFTPTPTAAGMLLISGTPPSSGPVWATWASLTPTPVWNFAGNTSNSSYGTYYMGTVAQGATNMPLMFKSESQGEVPSGIVDNINGNVYFGGQLNSSYPGGENTVINGATHNVGVGEGALGVPNSAGTAMIETAGGDPGVTNNVMFGYGTGLWTMQANSVAIGTASQRNISGNPAGSLGGPNTNLGNFCFRSSNGGSGFTALGIHNTAIGNENQYGITTASYNTSLGDLSMSAVSNAGTSYSYNTGVGPYTLYALTTGLDNTAIGYYAEKARTTGAFDVAAGYQALTANTTTGYNVALGYNALLTVSTLGNASTAIGANAAGLTTASHNVAVGDSALYSTTSGTFNTAVGYKALASTAVGNGNTTGTYNTAFGDSADVASAALTKTTSIGTRAYASTSNEIVLGEISGINGATANTNVGIGTNAPAADAALALKTNHLETQVGSTAPTTTVNALILGNGGSGGFTVGQGSTDVAGGITFTTPVSSGFGPNEITVNFATAYAFAPTVVVAPANAAAANAMTTYQVYTTSTTTGFTLNFNNVVGSANQTFNFNYFVVETQ